MTGSAPMKRIAMIGSLQHPELFERARRELGQDAECFIPTYGPTNAQKGYWHWAVDRADEVIVVRKPDGSIGAGTADELMHAVGIRKPIVWASWC